MQPSSDVCQPLQYVCRNTGAHYGRMAVTWWETTSTVSSSTSKRSFCPVCKTARLALCGNDVRGSAFYECNECSNRWISSDRSSWSSVSKCLRCNSICYPSIIGPATWRVHWLGRSAVRRRQQLRQSRDMLEATLGTEVKTANAPTESQDALPSTPPPSPAAIFVNTTPSPPAAVPSPLPMELAPTPAELEMRIFDLPPTMESIKQQQQLVGNAEWDAKALGYGSLFHCIMDSRRHYQQQQQQSVSPAQ